MRAEKMYQVEYFDWGAWNLTGKTQIDRKLSNTPQKF
jgi:hypothetical protein